MSPAVRQWLEGFDRMSPEEQAEARAAFQNHTVTPQPESEPPPRRRLRGRPPLWMLRGGVDSTKPARADVPPSPAAGYDDDFETKL